MAKKAQPTLYDGEELLKTHHVPVIVPSSKEDLELAETTRKKLHAKMNDSACVEKRINITPPNYLKENFMVTFTPQTQLTPEQVFYSIDLAKQKAEELKANALPLPVLPPMTVAMKAVFENLEAEVDQNEIDLMSGEIKWKNLLITNENLIAECLSNDVFYTTTNSVLNVSRFSNMHDAFTIAQKRIADLESENFNLRNKIQNDDHDSMIKHFSKLEVEHFNLQLKYQNLKERFGNKKPVTSSDAPSFDSLFVIGKLNEQIQSRGNTIRELKEKISRLTKKNSDADPIFDLKALVSQNKDLTAKLNALHDLNERFRAENAKVKQHYKELYDSIKITRAKTTDQNNSLLSEIENLKAQLKDNSKCVTIPDSKPKVLAPGRYPIDVEPIPPRLKKNREVHLHYIKHLKENVETLREIVEDAKVERPLDTSLASACRYTKHSQELLEYVLPSKQWKPTGRLLPLGRQCPLVRSTTLKSDCMPADPQETITSVVQIVLWYLDSGCSKHMTRDRSRLRNFVKKFIGTVRFENDHFGAIMGYGDYVIDLEVAFRKHTCFVRDLDGVDLIKGSRGTNLYTISVEDMMRSSPICLLSKASKNKSWLWHRRLNHLNFGTLNDLARKDLVRGLPRLKFKKDHLFTWVKFLRSKDETLAFVINLLKQLQVGLNKTVWFVRTDNGTEFNGVVERWNRTLVEAAWIMLIFSNAPLFLWAEVVATASKADIGFFVGYASNRKGYRIYNKWTRQIMETIHVTFDELAEQTAPVHSIDRLVPPAPAPQAPVNPTDPSVSIPIDQEAPSGSHSPSSLDHQSSSVHQDVAAEHSFEVNPFVMDDPEPFVNVFALGYNSEASSSGVIARTESNQTTQPHKHLQKWTASHPIDNIIRNPSRPISTQKQLTTDALWCFYNSVLCKVEPKNFKYAVTEDCWFQAMQDEIYEFDRLDVWELVPPPRD
ncbi:integrase, catalytic region, zinc finger, CCHC-type containing protein [Tanacetum coccineum]